MSKLNEANDPLTVAVQEILKELLDCTVENCPVLDKALASKRTVTITVTISDGESSILFPRVSVEYNMCHGWPMKNKV